MEMTQQDVDSIFNELNVLGNEIRAYQKKHENLLEDVDLSRRKSLINLLNYIVFRKHDIRELQDILHEFGLSSFSGSEGHIASQIVQVKKRLKADFTPEIEPVCSFHEGREILESNTTKLFGKRKDQLIPHIMVTFDAAFLENPKKIKELLTNGMNVARINCAHDDPKTWLKLIDELKKYSAKLDIPCKVFMDLAGPKIRTEILGKGSDKGKVKINEGDEFYLVDKPVKFKKKDVIIGCTLPNITQFIKVGERIMFDDGELEASVIEKSENRLKLQMLRNSKKSRNLKAEKGINFPDSDLEVPSLTDYDRECLPFVVDHADMVGYSFVNSTQDIQVLQTELNKYKKQPHIVLKIETPAAVKKLPSLLVQGMKENLIGVMIARGDLAVEIGFERMSEIQEEILWFCEAAHVPVIWATQVLETLHKTGIATRAEMTDAANAISAECIMINKGEYTVRVLRTLKDVLHRTSGHRYKKRYYLRPLNIAQNFTFKQPESK
ncbi:pyruvate kinase [Flavobacteriaceae bacterium Ap0902]|nr:pyruvate kinase [Flavobacteriaceae bacterium Ap0902]